VATPFIDDYYKNGLKNKMVDKNMNVSVKYPHNQDQAKGNQEVNNSIVTNLSTNMGKNIFI